MSTHTRQTHKRGITLRTRVTAVGLSVVIGFAAHDAALLGWPARESQTRSANDRMLEPGPEAARLSRRVGTWDVVMTMRPTPDAEPLVVRRLVAERVMIGLYLQETMRPSQGSDVPDFRRLEYLTYNAVEARWQYVSMDTRAPIGLMAARSFDPQQGASVTVYFDNSALAGFGPELQARLFRARHVTTTESNDRDVARQYWIAAGAKEWLAVQYEYTRRR
jgi:hypothetical protein